MVELVQNALKQGKVKIKDAVISILGLAYLADSDDTRNSPAFPIIENLSAKGATIRIHDPFVEDNDKLDIHKNIDAALSGSDCIVVVTEHSAYKDLKLKEIKGMVRTPIIVDGRNLFEKVECEAEGFIYKGVGK
jgi:UDP-N-acetyl-D-mannosaminuronic acid dehydrogenase